MRKTLIALSIIILIGSSAFAGPAGDTITVFSVSGDAKVVPKGSVKGIRCEKGMIVRTGDWVKTGYDSSVTLAFDREADNVITIEENSLVVIKLDGYFKVQLLRGDIYAILEDVKAGETFRVLTPSVVTESLSSGWGATTDGSYTNIVVFDNKVFVCGVNKDGSVDGEKYWIEEGYQRKTISFEDPGELKSAPEDALPWFKEQVVAHHLDKLTAKGGGPAPDGEEGASSENSDLLEYLLKQKLKHGE